MAKKSSLYWKKRMEALEDDQYQRSAAYYRDVQKQFQEASNNLQMDIERWYQRLADNNHISYTGAKKLLKKNELEEFYWSVEQYIKAGEENAVDQRWMKELENASARHHISYLEAMRLQTRQHAELLSAEFDGGMTDFLQKSYGDQYYRNAFEIARGTGVGSNIAQIDSRTIDALIKKPWAQDGKNFSDRIWTNKEKLVNSLHTELTQSIIRGTEPKQAINNLAKSMEVSRAQAGRLIMTESAAISSAAQKECFKDLDVERYEILATLDSHTSDICREMDGKIFEMEDYKVGETAPPFHPHCRSTTIPYFDDEFTEGEGRAARDEDTGKTYYVPADMTYREWKGGVSRDDDRYPDSDAESSLNRKAQKISELEEVHYNGIGGMIGRAPQYIQDIIEENYDAIKYLDDSNTKYGIFRSKDGFIDINLGEDERNPFGAYSVAFHEMGHCIDKHMGYVSQKIPDFSETLKRDTANFIKDAKKLYKTSDVYATISEELQHYNAGQSVADLLGATTGGKIKVPGRQHSKDYWKGPNKLEHEAFAHFFEATARNDTDKLDMIRTVFSNAYKAFENAIKAR